MKCQDAREALAQPNSDRTNAAKEHITTCHACLARLDQFARAILSEQEDEIPCAECRVRLPAYHAATQNNEDLTDELTVVAGHLDQCPYCAEEYRALREAMTAWETGALPELTEAPIFDLAFLGEPAGTAIWVSEATKQVRKLFADIVIAVREGAASFDSLQSPLAPRPAPAGAFRAAEEDTQTQILELDDEEANRTIEVHVGPATDGEAAIAVKIKQTSPAESVSRARVTLYDAEHQLLASSPSDEEGTVTFDHLRPDRYIVQVKQDGQRWEFPILLVQAEEPPSEQS